MKTLAVREEREYIPLNRCFLRYAFQQGIEGIELTLSFDKSICTTKTTCANGRNNVLDDVTIGWIFDMLFKMLDRKLVDVFMVAAAVINQYLRLSRPLPPTALSLLLASFIVAPMPPAALKISPTVMSHLLGCNISCCFLSKPTWTSKRVLCNHGAGSSGKDEPCSGKDEPCSRNSPSIASLFRLAFISLFPIWFGVVII